MAIPLLTPLLAFLFNANYNNSQEVNVIGISISLIIVSIVVILILLVRLKTKIDEKGVYYQFYPINFNEKFIPWSDISKCYVRKYNPIIEFGGWGYKMSPFGRGRVLNVKGNKGIQLELKNGKKLLLGTQKEELVKRTLEPYKYKFN